MDGMSICLSPTTRPDSERGRFAPAPLIYIFLDFLDFLRLAIYYSFMSCGIAEVNERRCVWFPVTCTKRA
jgi:hypothetical protein